MNYCKIDVSIFDLFEEIHDYDQRFKDVKGKFVPDDGYQPIVLWR